MLYHVSLQTQIIPESQLRMRSLELALNKLGSSRRVCAGALGRSLQGRSGVVARVSL